MTSHAIAYKIPAGTATAGAQLSQCRAYRYRLWRVWDAELPAVLFVMLNPSTADEHEDDATIRRCTGFARRWGFGGVEVVNLFAFRTTNPDRLMKRMHRRFVDAVGPDNDAYIWGALKRCKEVIVAWGAHDCAQDRAREVLELIDRAGAMPTCLGESKDGHPLHPLYLKKELVPLPFDAGRYSE